MRIPRDRTRRKPGGTPLYRCGSGNLLTPDRRRCAAPSCTGLPTNSMKAKSMATATLELGTYRRYSSPHWPWRAWKMLGLCQRLCGSTGRQCSRTSFTSHMFELWVRIDHVSRHVIVMLSDDPRCRRPIMSCCEFGLSGRPEDWLSRSTEDQV